MVYVAFVIDVHSRRIVGWKASRSMTADLVIAALVMATWTRRHRSFESVVCHSDTGRQDTPVIHTERPAAIGAVPSNGAVGDSFDAMAETVQAVFKTELYRHPAVLSRVSGHWTGLDGLEIETAM